MKQPKKISACICYMYGLVKRRDVGSLIQTRLSKDEIKVLSELLKKVLFGLNEGVK